MLLVALYFALATGDAGARVEASSSGTRRAAEAASFGDAVVGGCRCRVQDVVAHGVVERCAVLRDTSRQEPVCDVDL